MPSSRPRRWCLRATIGSLTVLTAAALATSSVGAAPTGPVSGTPAANTPQLANTGTTEQVRQMVQCGDTMYAVGSFTTIKRFTTVHPEQRLQLQRAPPFKVTSWNPNVNGIVNSIAFNGSDCTNAYIGGKFTSVNGTAVKNIADGRHQHRRGRSPRSRTAPPARSRRCSVRTATCWSAATSPVDQRQLGQPVL